MTERIYNNNKPIDGLMLKNTINVQDTGSYYPGEGEMLCVAVQSGEYH